MLFKHNTQLGAEGHRQLTNTGWHTQLIRVLTNIIQLWDSSAYILSPVSTLIHVYQKRKRSLKCNCGRQYSLHPIPLVSTQLTVYHKSKRSVTQMREVAQLASSPPRFNTTVYHKIIFFCNITVGGSTVYLFSTNDCQSCKEEEPATWGVQPTSGLTAVTIVRTQANTLYQLWRRQGANCTIKVTLH